MFSSFFNSCDEHFWFETNSVEVNLVYIFLPLVLLVCFQLQKTIMKYHFWTAVKNLKIPPAAVANQIAGKTRVSPAHERKKIKPGFTTRVKTHNLFRAV